MSRCSRAADWVTSGVRRGQKSRAIVVPALQGICEGLRKILHSGRREELALHRLSSAFGDRRNVSPCEGSVTLSRNRVPPSACSNRGQRSLPDSSSTPETLGTPRHSPFGSATISIQT